MNLWYALIILASVVSPFAGHVLLELMDKWYMKLWHAYLIVIASFIWPIGGSLLFDQMDVPVGYQHIAGLFFPFIFIFLFATTVWGRAKGYSPGVGFFLGCLTLLGLFFLLVLPKEPHYLILQGCLGSIGLPA